MSTREHESVLRVVVADDERPARRFLIDLLHGCDDVSVVGEASDGAEAVTIIERERPDLALLDLQMPEVDGLEVVGLLRRDVLPLVAFVTAFDAYAIRAFELNALDYLLKPVDAARLRRTLARAHERLDMVDAKGAGIRRAELSAETTEAVARVESGRADSVLRRIPVRRRDDVLFVPVAQVVLIVADGELLQLATASGERHTITYRLKDLEARLPEGEFVRLSRSALVRTDAIQRMSPMPGGTYIATLHSGQRVGVSRIRARVIREQMLKL
ncbi:MAG TPA: response regulator [Gemmatimonas sp.]|nr:response regulator [Gemmatimonas sp.]